MLTDKQKKVIAFCHANDGRITKKQAMELIDTHYHNGDKHVGETLSRMVKAGLLIREKPGHFRIGKGTRLSNATIIDNQPDLF